MLKTYTPLCPECTAADVSLWSAVYKMLLPLSGHLSGKMCSYDEHAGDLLVSQEKQRACSCMPSSAQRRVIITEDEDECVCTEGIVMGTLTFYSLPILLPASMSTASFFNFRMLSRGRRRVHRQ